MPTRKCENCGKEVNWRGRQQRAQRLRGWTATGRSQRYGKQYDQRGIAWWCPRRRCQEAQDMAVLGHALPGTPERYLKMLLRDAELSGLRRN